MALVPPGSVTMTSTVDGAGMGGSWATRLPADAEMIRPRPARPNVTAVTQFMSVPATVTRVPPLVRPEDGVTEVTVGRAR